jgi:hypothetical protein
MHEDSNSKSTCENDRQMARALWPIRFGGMVQMRVMKPALDEVSFSICFSSELSFSNSDHDRALEDRPGQLGSEWVSEGSKSKVSKASNKSPSNKKGGNNATTDCLALLPSP